MSVDTPIEDRSGSFNHIVIGHAHRDRDRALRHEEATFSFEEAGEPGDLRRGDHGSLQSLEAPQLLQTILHLRSSIRAPQRSQM